MKSNNTTVLPAILEINKQYDYDDENPGGKRDAALVSCAQCEEYNELQYIYDTHLKPLVDSRKILQSKAIQSLEECCSEMVNPRNRVKYYKLLGEKLGVKIG